MASELWLENLAKLIEPLRPPTEAECRRTANMGRLACALEIMAERGAPEPAIRDMMTWHRRPDFEALLDAWEAESDTTG